MFRIRKNKVKSQNSASGIVSRAESSIDPSSMNITKPELTTLDQIRLSNQIHRAAYRDKLLELYKDLRVQSIKNGGLYFSVELNKLYINRDELTDIINVAKADSLKAVYFEPYLSDSKYIVFCDPKLHHWLYGFNEDVIDLYQIKYHSSKVCYQDPKKKFELESLLEVN
jgi:hypothetical protein